MASLPYETATSGDRALMEIQKILGKFGCQSFGHMIDAERGMTVVQFRWRDRQIQLEASWKGYAAAWQKAHPWATVRGNDRAAYDRKALEIGRTAVCSVLRDWVKGQVTAIECGVLSFDAVFMPHMLLPSGERVIDRVEASQMLPRSEQSNGSACTLLRRMRAEKASAYCNDHGCPINVEHVHWTDEEGIRRVRYRP